MKPQPWLVLVLAGALLGLVFAGISTYDFVQHLDRQVHSVHCSFIPGLGKEAGETGCQVAMMSPYSSVFRTAVWGGIPISLPAMAVFAFLAVLALDLVLTRRQHDPRATAFLALACGLPAATSLVMLVISLTKLGTTCKLCVGIYVASAACVTGAVATWRKARAAGPAIAPVRVKKLAKPVKQALPDEPAFTGVAPVLPRAASEPPEPLRPAALPLATSNGFLAGAFATGLAFVALPVGLYLALAPDHARYIGTCDALVKPEDGYGVMVRVTADKPAANAARAIEILDPLCPACRAFEHRLAASGLSSQLDRSAVMFPLDNTCNWMVTEATHPGACAVSEAVLCAAKRDPDGAPAVIAWAFSQQEQIREAAKADPAAAARLVRERFPELAACVGSPEARSRLNKSMRWAVANNVRVLTPQLFIDNVKLCDEDVDLGLEYTLKHMLDRHAAGTLAPTPLEAPIVAEPKPAPKPEPTPEPASKPAPKFEPAPTAKPVEPRPAKTTTPKAPEDKPFVIPDRRPPEDEPSKPADPPPPPPPPADPAPPPPAPAPEAP